MVAWKRWMSEYIPMYHAVTEIMIITSNRVPRSAGSINHIFPPSFPEVRRVPFIRSGFVFHSKCVCSVSKVLMRLSLWSKQVTFRKLIFFKFFFACQLTSAVNQWSSFGWLGFNNVKHGETLERICCLKRKRVDDSSNTSSSVGLHWQGCYLLGCVCPRYCLLFRARSRLTPRAEITFRSTDQYFLGHICHWQTSTTGQQQPSFYSYEVTFSWKRGP